MMKRIMVLLVALILSCTVFSAFAEGVIILSSPDMNRSSGNSSLDDMKLGEPIDTGDRIYTPQKYETKDMIQTTAYDYIKSGAEAEFLTLWIDVLNFSNKEQILLHDAQIVATYESDRGAYQFGGNIYQCLESCGPVKYNAENMKPIQPLYNGYYLIYCAVPNFVINNAGELKLEITSGTTKLTYFVRYE